MTESFDLTYKRLQDCFNEELTKFCESLNTQPEVLGESMKYSLTLGGKRVRPVLMLAVGELLGVEKQQLLPYACALEAIHTYSLIHDDLPEMDNDDFRRGKPSNHKVYGQANAVLAGDGLLNTAYSLLFDQCLKGNEYVSAAKLICECAGIRGMIAGQSADILYENANELDESTLEFIYENKTAKLITAAVTVPSVLCHGAYYPELKQFGKKLGYLFQLSDDILDVCGDFKTLGKTIGKDEKEGKYTCVNLYGLEASKLRADIIGDDCNKLLDGIDGDVEFLRGFVNFVKSRLN